MALKKGENAPDHAAGGRNRPDPENGTGSTSFERAEEPRPSYSQRSPSVPQQTETPFWEKPLSDLTRAEWEQLCDGCGRCCLVKLEDEDTGAIYHTSVACKLLDQQSCRCGDYPRRRRYVPDCVRLTLEKLADIPWLPPTCAYVLRFRGKPLPPWHPLISGDPESVSRAGVSARGRIEAGEDDVETDDLPDFIRLWPKRWPKKARW
ncbi:YcgN family cysteine cluster protein [Methylocystis sp. H4A]|uniref:YcgN family cysteine cluster protein n=1 Tax=Methylocystis sp. H4A TaxID=2785788 RepID=UPI0018C2FED2|nr:YcgN family cysteine cluster protein [Methylocystis sp. H4A]MBG0800843.1 YcgN family cysteine cluster protein [Methylocystis sp. H4A]